MQLQAQEGWPIISDHCHQPQVGAAAPAPAYLPSQATGPLPDVGQEETLTTGEGPEGPFGREDSPHPDSSRTLHPHSTDQLPAPENQVPSSPTALCLRSQ